MCLNGCGQKPLWRDYDKPPIRQCKSPPEPCPHLLAPTGEVELIHCKTCQGRVRQKFAVSGCALHGVCLPTYGGEEGNDARVCRKCPDNPANKTKV